jgi:hypothetical protein
MTEKDVTRISIGQDSIGIIGIKVLMNELAATYGDKPDEEVRSVMLDRLGRSNYIPDRARDDYGKAFVREFRKFMGQSDADDTPQGLDIKVLGAGCNQCRTLTQAVMEVLTELDLPAGVDHVTDMREIARYGIMGSPVLLINGRAVAVGSVPPRARIKKLLAEASAAVGGK